MVVGRFAAGANATPMEISDKAIALARKAAAKEAQSLADEVIDVLHKGGKAVAGLAEVLTAVQDDRAFHIIVLSGFAHPTTLRFDHVNTRRAGQRLFVDLHMHMPPNWSLQRAAALRTSVEQALMAAVPGLRATIQLLPMDVEAHFDDTADKVL